MSNLEAEIVKSLCVDDWVDTTLQYNTIKATSLEITMMLCVHPFKTLVS